MNNNIDDKIKDSDGKIGEIPESDEKYIAGLKLGFYEMSAGLNKILVENNYLFPTTMCFCKLIGL